MTIYQRHRQDIFLFGAHCASRPGNPGRLTATVVEGTPQDGSKSGISKILENGMRWPSSGIDVQSRLLRVKKRYKINGPGDVSLEERGVGGNADSD